MARPDKSAQLDNKLTAITIEGFKSIRSEKTLHLSALNILAGANSAGKSSFMQPLLLLKQTMEASYDPGPLLINGPNVKFTENLQMFSKPDARKPLRIGFSMKEGESLQLSFDLDEKKQLAITESLFSIAEAWQERLTESAEAGYLLEVAKNLGMDLVVPLDSVEFGVSRQRAFFDLTMFESGRRLAVSSGLSIKSFGARLGERVSRNIIHVPGLRGNPERSYPKTAVGSNYPGTLDSYVASIISEWQETADERLQILGNQLQALGLTWKVSAKKVDDTRVELQVGRLPTAGKSGAKDLVSIADVGFGVSQVMPVLVALLVARPGQIVYIEQPETHLHPRAQRALAEIFALAAHGQATVVVETHSLIFIRAVQTLVAKQELAKELVKLHWVERDAKGDTTVTTRELDNAGAYGDWPQDFEATEMAVEQDYLDAAEKVLFNHG